MAAQQVCSAQAEPQRTARSALRTLAALALVVLALATVGAERAQAREGDSRATLFVGTTTFGISDETTRGATFGLSYGYEFETDLLWTVGIAFASTDGTATVSDGSGGTQEVPLEARTAQYSAGLLAYLGRGGAFSPYVGGGLSAVSYDLEFAGTDVGTVSGTAPGAYVAAGVEARLSRSFTIIPQFGVEVHSVKTESGATTGLISGGLTITLRVGV